MTWYKSPFIKGSKYYVLKKYSELGHNFGVGDIVESTDDSYDAKLGLIRFWFRDVSTGEIKVFHVWEDSNDLELQANQYFSKEKPK